MRQWLGLNSSKVLPNYQITSFSLTDLEIFKNVFDLAELFVQKMSFDL